jgi:hypothetical protein
MLCYYKAYSFCKIDLKLEAISFTFSSVFCPSIQCPAIEYSFSARGCLGELYRVLGLGEPFLGELKLILELVEGFLEELKLVLGIVEFFCLLVQQL